MRAASITTPVANFSPRITWVRGTTVTPVGRGLSARAAVTTKRFIHYGETSAANLHYCDWIRRWNDLCLQIYGEISVRNPSFLERFNEN